MPLPRLCQMCLCGQVTGGALHIPAPYFCQVRDEACSLFSNQYTESGFGLFHTLLRYCHIHEKIIPFPVFEQPAIEYSALFKRSVCRGACRERGRITVKDAVAEPLRTR